VRRKIVRGKRKKVTDELPIQENQCLLAVMYGRGKRSAREILD
jgi:hypothetical protein